MSHPTAQNIIDDLFGMSKSERVEIASAIAIMNSNSAQHQCLKTGCMVYMPQYNEWAYGDAHLVGDTLVIRSAETGRVDPGLSGKAALGRVHFTINRIDYWPDKNDSRVQYPLIMSAHGGYVYHGHEGVPL